MPRATASALTVLLLLPLSWPLLQSGSESLPPCCRRNGKHHCAMMMRFGSWDSEEHPALRSWADLCPYHSLLFAPPTSGVGTVPSPHRFQVRLIPNPNVILQMELEARISEARCHHKRGPPNFS